jgi:hypothetical protein
MGVDWVSYWQVGTTIKVKKYMYEEVIVTFFK